MRSSTSGAYVRKDFYNYFPSGNPLADKGPPNLQNQTIGQYRTLFNTGVRSDYSYVKGINNIKAGAVYEQTFLRENDNLAVVAPTFNSPCVDANGNSAARLQRPVAVRGLWRYRQSGPTIRCWLPMT